MRPPANRAAFWLDWCRGSSLDRLARRSFELHAELSAELGDPWGYRRLTTYGGYAFEGDSARGAPGRSWLADGVAITSRLGSPHTTALVEPRAFTTGLMHAAQAHGAVAAIWSSTWCAAQAGPCAA